MLWLDLSRSIQLVFCPDRKIRPGVYKRDFSSEELYENTESYPYLDGSKRKASRFAIE